MGRFGLCGPTYQSISPVMDAEWAMNLYLENIESPNGRSAGALLGIDGTSLFASLGNAATGVAGLFTFAGRTFAVGLGAANQTNLYEVLANGTVQNRGQLGAVPPTSAPAIWAANPTQIALTVGGFNKVFVLTLGTNNLTNITLSAGNAASVAYLDGFGVALIAASNTFMVSNSEDFTTWQAINTGTISEFPDQAVSMIVNGRRLWFLGQKQSVPYYNAGALFPFIPVPDTLIEEGSAAVYGVAKLDNTIFWIGGNVDQGRAVGWRMSGSTPQRITNHAIETIWQSYSTIADAITYTFQSRGHKFWHVYFPTANASWRYDIATNMWHQVGFWNAVKNRFDAHRSQCHTFNFGLHLVGDPANGNIYSMSPNTLTDNNQPIRRVWRSPPIAREHDWMFHRQLEVLCESGLPSQIQAASVNPPFLNIADANGVLWTVTINDNGVISVLQAAPGQVASGAVILADSVNQTTFWQLVVSVGGVLSGAQVSVGNPRVAIFQMASTPVAPNTIPLDTGLQVSQAGVVTSIPPQAHYRAPQLLLRWSDDAGHTWSNLYPATLGLTGEFTARAVWRRLGKSRNRIYEISCSDPIALRIVDGFLDANPDFKPAMRLAHRLAESA